MASLQQFSLSQSLLWKLPLLEAFAEGISIGFTAPQPPPAKSETDGYDVTEARETLSGVGVWGPRLFKTITRSAQLYESFLILHGLFPATMRGLPILSWLQPSPWTLARIMKLRATPSFAIGAALICLGAYIRVICFRHLGKQFTFQLSIRKDHRLITDGPYSIVRHPSYSGAVLQVMGMVLCLCGPGSWFKEIGMHTAVGRVISAIVGFIVATATYGGIARTFKEDVVLRNTFKGEWEEWAKKTPYRLFPYIF